MDKGKAYDKLTKSIESVLKDCSDSDKVNILSTAIHTAFNNYLTEQLGCELLLMVKEDEEIVGDMIKKFKEEFRKEAMN